MAIQGRILQLNRRHASILDGQTDNSTLFSFHVDSTISIDFARFAFELLHVIIFSITVLDFRYILYYVLVMPMNALFLFQLVKRRATAILSSY